MQRRKLNEGIGDLKGMTWRPVVSAVRTHYLVHFHLTRRQKIALIVAFLLAWAFLHVALHIVFATQPVQAQPAKLRSNRCCHAQSTQMPSLAPKASTTH